MRYAATKEVAAKASPGTSQDLTGKSQPGGLTTPLVMGMQSASTKRGTPPMNAIAE